MKSSALFGLFIYVCALCLCSAAASATGTSRSTPVGRTTDRAADLSVLPERPQVFHDPEGTGIAVYGVLNGEAQSAQSVLLAVLEAQRSDSHARFRFFDDIPQLQAVVAERTDQNVQALFSATYRGTPVLAVVSVSLDDGSSVSLLFDRPGSFSNSFLRLRQAPAQTGRLAYIIHKSGTSKSFFRESETSLRRGQNLVRPRH